ncbi:MAG: integrase arm-type DNA-binding domain-containing protein [Pseudomonadota bacterium]
MSTSRDITADRQIAALKPTASRYERAVAGARGLCLIVYPTGTKTFVLRYVAVGGERRRLPLGNYPGLSLAEARERAAAHQVAVVEGADPAEARAIAKEVARTGETLEELAEAYWRAAAKGLHGGRRRPKRDRTLQNERSLWKAHIQGTLGNRRFADLRRADIKIFMRELALEGRLRPASIASVGGVLSNILGFAVHEDRIEANPALGLTRPLAWESRSRLFDDVALAALWATLEEAAVIRKEGEQRGDPHARMGPQMALALQFLILTLSRRTEVAGARWTEVDLAAGTWTIPAERTKPKRIHIVPLSPAAAKILQKARALAGRSHFVFPSPKDPAEHLDPHALTRAVTRLCKRLELPPGSPHDFRRSGATTLTGERYGIRRFIVGKVLSHDPKEGAAVTAVYDRNEYLPEKRAALAAWASHVLELQPTRGNQARAA